MTAILELDGLEVRYGAVPAVRKLSFQVDKGEIVGLIGPNGAGKSTTLHAIMGLVPAHAGEIRLDGRSIRGRAPEAVVRSGIALVPEGRRIYAHLTVEENLRLGLAGRRSRDLESLERDFEWVYELFPIVARSSPGARPAPCPAASSSSSRSPARSSPGRTCCSSTSRRSGSRRSSSTSSSRRWRRSASAASPCCSSSSGRSGRSRSPTARTCSRTASSRPRSAPKDADDTERLIAAYFGR